ncbi:hypothetical protein F0M18_15620 [Pseudohalioglobus sediminis]|uniref:Uncharacterized protein n=1 Tax=Pseudohalioglobus sediminis TaxID=2606449 RepID=A0A5B0WS75_9GAMM|nr:hypothetical protein [Pseudohalioglobus sediminis]KAA1189773.1 hypothetical protein F0M18_15620 [Pseudohalioglobus sediminis]
MLNRLKNAPFNQQLALLAAALCLLVSLALVILAAISSKHLQSEQQTEFGNALAHQIARRVSTALETGDLLSITASLQRFVETSSAVAVAMFDVEGKALGEAGAAQGQNLSRYRAPVRIEEHTAGEILVTINTDSASAAHQRFVLSLLGLAVLLSLAAYGGGSQLGKRLSARVGSLSRQLALEDSPLPAPGGNEFTLLEKRIAALPMDLLRTRNDTEARDENYRSTAVLFLQLESLASYVDTLDDQSLHRYTDRLHQVVYAAAGFYGGELHVSRQFALTVYFSGPNNAGSAPFRAASCAWLVKAVAAELEQNMALSMKMALAISQSELGIGDARDIYPGLYMQHTLDELQAVCASKPPKILLSPAVIEDTDIQGRLQLQATEVMDYAMLESFAGPYQDLLERQLQLILKRLMDPALI